MQIPQQVRAVSGRRYYSPSQGRFLGRDPKGEPGGLNLYGFVRNSPTNAWDYLGMTMMAAVSSHTKIEKETDENGCEWEVIYSDISDVSYGIPEWIESGRTKVSCPKSSDPDLVEISLADAASSGTAPGPASPRAPSKQECDRLRKSSPALWQNSGSKFASQEEAAIAATIRVGVASAAGRWEHSSVVFQDNKTGLYSFTSPTRATGNSPAGGGALINNPSGTTLVGLTHGHNIGHLGWVSAHMRNGVLSDSLDLSVDNYNAISNMFSIGDQSTAVRLQAPVYLYSATNDIRKFDPSTNPAPRPGVNSPGELLSGGLGEGDIGMIAACLASKL